MRRIEPKRELKHYESEGSAIRRIMNEKLVTHHDRGVDTPHYQATMKKQGKVKLRKSGDYDDHGTHTVYASPEDVRIEQTTSENVIASSSLPSQNGGLSGTNMAVPSYKRLQMTK